MPLSKEMTDKSLSDLKRSFEHEKDDAFITLLTATNECASQDNFLLSAQGDQFNTLLQKILLENRIHLSDSNSAELAKEIYKQLTKISDKQTKKNQSTFLRNGVYGRIIPIHQHANKEKEMLQSHDIALLMPNSSKNIKVLDDIQYTQAGIDSIKDEIKTLMANDTIKHIFIPINSALHWRALYITKPLTDAGPIEIEIMGPYGKSDARALSGLPERLLQESKRKIVITYTGPKNPQTDSHSCGDYTCAYTHKKMKALSNPKDIKSKEGTESFNQAYINVLDSMGDKKNALRTCTLEHSKREKSKVELKILKLRSQNTVPVIKKTNTLTAILEQNKKWIRTGRINTAALTTIPEATDIEITNKTIFPLILEKNNKWVKTGRINTAALTTIPEENEKFIEDPTKVVADISEIDEPISGESASHLLMTMGVRYISASSPILIGLAIGALILSIGLTAGLSIPASLGIGITSTLLSSAAISFFNSPAKKMDNDEEDSILRILI